ncbi:transcription factor [Wallemia mellicola]|uniref:Transcription factor n=1 Tax=Wallemia mellicola TaxID=1708541 RepID=A0A4T0LLV9_9BASI|nr:hypothetical protein E3Q24_02845 [Wallemia mellicola]TIB88664.1 transcription factor [Wallemia mellicola]TIB91339.1 transcription factor [Wallemia mellicola]TIC07121.1 transcription factor [Wallemia mellicola]TIC19640.1 transcription factor [Wallemia mellicola]
MVNVTYGALNPENTIVPGGTDFIATQTTGEVNAYNPGDMTWVLTCTALVWIMIPGLSFLYSGLARRKNALNMVFLCFVSTSIVSFQWFFWGFSLCFSRNSGTFFGKLDHFGFINVLDYPAAAANDKIPEIIFAIYQGMFACLVPAIMIGAAAERSRVAPAMVFIFVWTTLCYDPLVAWIWNPNGWAYKWGVLDYAGGVPVEIASGVSGLVYSIFIGKRRGYGTEAVLFKPHNVSHIVLGTVLLWAGWLGFNGGSTYAANLKAGMSILTTNLAGSFGALTWLIMDYRLERKWSVVGFCTGAICGLVAITPAAGFVGAPASILIGFLASLVSNLSTRLKNIARVDDVMDIFACHGLSGMVGTFLTGIFAQASVAYNDAELEIDGGWIDRNFVQLGKQVAWIAVGTAWVFVVTYAIMFVINLIPGLRFRVDEEGEIMGLDEREHGEFTADYVEMRRHAEDYYVMPRRGLVKAALSSDTLVIKGKLSNDAQIPQEVVVHLDGIQGPRVGSNNKPDEPLAYEARQFVIDAAVGKLVDFDIIGSVEANNLNFGVVNLPNEEGVSQDLKTHILSHGWAKLRTTNDSALNVIQDYAKTKQRGIWGLKQQRDVLYTMPSDLQSFVDKYSRNIFTAVVEQVRDGHTLRLRLLLSDLSHQYITLALAGVRSPKVGREDLAEAAEEFGPQARLYVETKCLQQKVKVRLFATNNTSSLVIGNITLNDGSSLAECVIANGFAKFADWHAAILASNGPSYLPSLKVAEKFAKENKMNIWQNFVDPIATQSTADVAANGNVKKNTTQSHPRQSEVIVSRIWSGDQISVIPFNKDGSEGVEKRIQIASIRQPRSADTKQAYWGLEAREFMRKKLIGKKVIYQHDYTRPKEEGFDEREAATIRFGGSQNSIGLLLVERGLATVIRHRRNDDRSHEYDELLIAEQAALSQAKGVHSNKELPIPRIPDASESYAKASSFLPQWKRSGKIAGVVEYVASGSRFKVYIPRDNQKITLVLSGLKAPRTARNPSEKSEEGAVQSLEFATRQLLQRDVEIIINGVDKAGGFVGTIYNTKGDNYGLSLVRRGLASVHEYSAESLPFADALFDAEQEAKDKKLGVWVNYNPAAEREAEEEAYTQAQEEAKEDEKSTSNLIDILISDVRSSPQFSFFVQLVGSEDSQKFERLMNEFTAHHKSISHSEPFAPRNGMLIAARFSQDNQWYRARVRRVSDVLKTAEVIFIDYGNEETVSYSDIRNLDDKFKTMPPQAIPAKLSFVNLLPIDHEYGQESLDRFKELCLGRNLVAKIDAKEPNGTLHLRLLDPSDPDSAISAEYCINADLVADGLALIDKKTSRYSNKYPGMQATLQDALQSAKDNRAGAFEYGDITED